MMSNLAQIYQLRFWIKNISPCVWRRVLIKDSCTITDLHNIIQITLDWCDTYLNQFKIRGKIYGVYHDGGVSFSDNPDQVCMKDFAFYPNERFLYEYNFFDSWEVEIRMEKPTIIKPKSYYPNCIGGRCAAPPEDCGGALRYMELLNHYTKWRLEDILLESCKQYQIDKDKEAFMETLENLKFWNNREYFNRRDINHRLKQYANGDPEWEDNFM